MACRLKKALARDYTHSVEDVVARINQGRAQWWSNGDAAIVTEIYDAPQKRWLHYWVVAGELGDCLALQPDIERWAQKQGCTEMTALGRQGWAPVLQKCGWHVRGWQYAKPLEVQRV